MHDFFILPSSQQSWFLPTLSTESMVSPTLSAFDSPVGGDVSSFPPTFASFIACQATPTITVLRARNTLTPASFEYSLQTPAGLIFSMVVFCNFKNSGHGGLLSRFSVLQFEAHCCTDSSRFEVRQPLLYSRQAALNVR